MIRSLDFGKKFIENYNKGLKNPRISFFFKENDKFISCDNTLGRCVLEEFNTPKECIRWMDENYEYTSKDEPRLHEWLTFQNLLDPESTSNFTKEKRRIRTHFYKGENIASKYIECRYDSAHDSITFYFLTPATMKAHDSSYICKETDPNRGFALKLNPSNTYTMEIKVLNFTEYLLGTRPDTMKNIPITPKEIKECLETCYVQLHCSDPSFVYQGTQWWLDQLDGSIYHQPIAPQVWNKPGLHGPDGNFLCKHLMGLINTIGFWLNPMASSATRELKKLGII